MGPPRIFDRHTYRRRRMRASGEAFLAIGAAEQLSERLSAVNRKFAAALDLGSRAAGFVSYSATAAHWTRVATHGDEARVIADEEILPFADESFDLVVSLLSLHAVNDLPGTLVQIRRALKPDGLFVAALFAGDTLQELRRAFLSAESDAKGGASPRVAPFADVRELGGLLQRVGFSMPVADVERTVVRYAKLDTLISDLRSMGETNALVGRSRVFLRRDTLSAAMAEYKNTYGDRDGRFRATFDIAYLMGWAPHISQPVPLRPGSAKARLADALGTQEVSAGEKPT